MQRQKKAKNPVPRLIINQYVCLFLSTVGMTILGFFLFGQPYKRGFFCNDESLTHPYVESTVTSFMLYVTGLVLPICTVSHFSCSTLFYTLYLLSISLTTRDYYYHHYRRCSLAPRPCLPCCSLSTCTFTGAMLLFSVTPALRVMIHKDKTFTVTVFGGTSSKS